MWAYRFAIGCYTKEAGYDLVTVTPGGLQAGIHRSARVKSVGSEVTPLGSAPLPAGVRPSESHES